MAEGNRNVIKRPVFHPLAIAMRDAILDVARGKPVQEFPGFGPVCRHEFTRETHFYHIHHKVREILSAACLLPWGV